MNRVLKQCSNKKSADLMRPKANARLDPLKLTIFASSFDPNQKEIDMEQVWKLLRESFAVATYAEENYRVRKFF